MWACNGQLNLVSYLKDCPGVTVSRIASSRHVCSLALEWPHDKGQLVLKSSEDKIGDLYVKRYPGQKMGACEEAALTFSDGR